MYFEIWLTLDLQKSMMNLADYRERVMEKWQLINAKGFAKVKFNPL